jgi:putative ABC transport system permease protein
MFKSYWTMAWRTLVRKKIYSIVNVLGLALGICTCMVIWVIVRYEFSFDRHHQEGSRIYRLNSYFQIMKNEPERLVPYVPADLPEAVRKGVPGVEILAPFDILDHDTATVVGTGKQKAGYPATPIVAGPEYFRIMTYDWLAGSEQTALVNPFSVVLTESIARKYFGNGPLNNLIGQEIVYQDSLHVHVSGIIRDWSEHTDFPYTDFISWSTVDHSFLLQSLGLDPTQNNKGTAMEAALLKLGPKTDPDQVRTVLSTLYKRHDLAKFLYPHIELQPLSAVHFTPVGGDNVISTAQKSVLYALFSIALFILALAMINYVNLATAQSMTREKEISIRKVMGSGRFNLIVQLLTETFLLTALAGLIALLTAGPVLHVFQQFIPSGLQFSPFAPTNLLFLLGITVLTTLLAGLYPARLLSAHSPVPTLKGAGAPRGGEKWWLRRGLIVFQFTISLLFIIGTMVIGRQISFMLHKDLGFRSDAIVSFSTDERKDSVSKARSLAETIRQVAGVADVARENMPPMGSDRGIFTIRPTANSPERLTVEAITTDEHYIPLYGIRLLAGRNLFPSDTLKEVVINESLSKALGFTSPDKAIGKRIYTWNKYVPIVGVVADFHKYSYRAPIQPLLLAGIACTDIAVRLDTRGRSAGEARAILARIERQWKTFYPHRPFEFSFFDDDIAQLYKREQTMEWLMDIATGITLLISCIGLFGLTLFATARRTREIGIRKVMGARVTDILTLLGKDFVVLVLIALVIASAGGWYGMHWWLQDYAYRVNIGADVFLLAGGAMLLVTVLTVGAQSLKAALANPIKSLRTE